MSSTDENIYDLIVIGAGMMGSAAAYHASQITNTTVCLVGPPEPKVRMPELSTFILFLIIILKSIAFI